MPDTPFVVSSVQSGTTTADVEIEWNPLMQTGGVPLTGYKLYMLRVSTSVQTLIYDGTNNPATTMANITNLVLGEEYIFTVTGLNPDEGPSSG